MTRRLVIVKYRTTASAVERRRARRRAPLLALTAVLALAACASPHQRLADSLTRAVMANDLSPVMNDLAPSVEGVVTRVRVAEWSDEMAARGAFQGVKQTRASWCAQGVLCFDAQFENGSFREEMKIAKDGKVTYLWIQPVRSPKQS